MLKKGLLLLLIIGLCSSTANTFQTQSDYERKHRFKTELVIRMSHFIHGVCYGSIFTAYMNDCCSLHLIAKIIAAGFLSHIAAIGTSEMTFPRNSFFEQEVYKA